MSEYGVTKKGFVLKRLDSILGDLHKELSEGFGFDTRLEQETFLNVLVITFGSQIAELWEIAQNEYYAKNPATAEGINLDNANQYGGIRRAKNRATVYSLHCTGDDGTTIKEGTIVASATKPKIKLMASETFKITRENFNKIKIKVVANEKNTIYSVSINGVQYSYSHLEGGENEILNGLREAIKTEQYHISVEEKNKILIIEDTILARNNSIILSENLTTESVSTIANFKTEYYGKIVLPNKTITEIITSMNGFHSIVNLLEPIYGRLEETDVEFRQSYILKSAIRSSRMIDSITSQLINNVANVESATGYENETNKIDEAGRPPHSIEIVVEGGKEEEIAQVILSKKSGGIQTYGEIEVPVVGEYGDTVYIRFNRPEQVYTWIKVILYGNLKQLPENYIRLVLDSILQYTSNLVAGQNLISQMLMEGIYHNISGIDYVKILCASSLDKTYIPTQEEYKFFNIEIEQRQKIQVSETRIEVSFDGDI